MAPVSRRPELTEFQHRSAVCCYSFDVGFSSWEAMLFIWQQITAERGAGRGRITSNAAEFGGPLSRANHQVALNHPLYLISLQNLSKHYQKAAGRCSVFSLLSWLTLHPIPWKRERWSSAVGAPVNHSPQNIWSEICQGEWRDCSWVSFNITSGIQVGWMHVGGLALLWGRSSKTISGAGHTELPALPIGWGRAAWPSAARMQL